ncbi:heavy metal translocating P-type ATPase [Pollutimonas bauzanensis]|uniref:P-type Zn(2+) transporter n=1 Tax=Pollutimonas bauzanensis TaxID=658167 RepID=A0A1M5Z5N3_9BURK|nr:heavy metal translocating P-type ATPase [Pollutimonas bauzanensis]SHI19520.1 Cd2+/Zn2+-exporting ATPase [Pollutimonas bauzanensis]
MSAHSHDSQYAGGPAGPGPSAQCCSGHGGGEQGHGHAPHGSSHAHEPAAIGIAPLPAQQAVPGGARTAMRIMQMDCPTEEALIRRKLEPMEGVHGVQFNLMQRVLTVDHAAPALGAILQAIRSLGFEPELAQQGQPLGKAAPAPARPWWPLAVAALAAVGAEALGWLGDFGWAVIALALLAVALSGLDTYKKGLLAVRNGNLNINALMSIAVTGALALGNWPEAAMVMVLFSIAEFIEARSLDRARHAVERLMEVAPETVWAQGADGAWASMAAAAVQPGTVLRARPGERIGLDGRVVAGSSVVDQAPITGESMPVEKTVGDQVYAGTINGMAEIEYRAEAAFSNTMLARIIHAVQAAQGSKAPIQRFVDRFARIYTPIVCLLALLVAVVPPLALGQPWLEWVYKALVLLVIACPCALVISTPVAIVSGLAAAARHGILVKGGVYLEEGRKLAWLALDKTGTLTQGKPQQTDFLVLGGSHGTSTAHAGSALGAAELRRLAASLAARSDHPVSQAIVRAYDGQELLPVGNSEAVPGGGTRGDIAGAGYMLGSPRWVDSVLGARPAGAELARHVAALQEQGKTVAVLAAADRALAVFAVADAVKPSSRQAIAELHGLGVRTAMLSGDNSATARGIAEQVGIDSVQSELMPEDKLQAIERYAAQGAVGMVGDGINDAPALARADIGFAMGAMGSDTAIETADVALMDDDLRKIPRFIRLSRATHAVLVQNISIALGIKAVFLLLTLWGLGTMWMAVFADVGASLLVLANSLRLLRK